MKYITNLEVMKSTLNDLGVTLAGDVLDSKVDGIAKVLDAIGALLKPMRRSKLRNQVTALFT